MSTASPGAALREGDGAAVSYRGVEGRSRASLLAALLAAAEREDAESVVGPIARASAHARATLAALTAFGRSLVGKQRDRRE